MFSESAALYDAIYAAIKDYAAECADVAALLRSVHPAAETILDVGCGTGEHAKHLRADHGFSVDGLDLDAGLLAVARSKVPQARFFEADMSDFALAHRYDVVLCLFSSIGYLVTLDRVTAALSCFRAHLHPGGVVVVEPWFAPGVLREGPGAVTRVAIDGLRIERTSRVTVAGRLSRLVFGYRVEDAEGVRLAQEVHELGLFTPEDMLAAFDEARLAVRHDPTGLTGRGLYIARPRE